MNGFPWITALTLTPLIGAILLCGLEPHQNRLARGFALAFSLVSLGLAGILWANFDSSLGSLQFAERWSWVPTLGVEYFVAVDGLGLLMVMLSTIIVPMAILASWRIEERVPIYFALVLFLEAGLLGTFTALNFFHWFIYWELSLVPAFFLIKLWGGPNRSSAAIQFFVYTMVGSVAMLLAFLALAYATGTFDFGRLAELARSGELASALTAKFAGFGLSAQQWSLILFVSVFLGFAVKLPVIPFHTWLPSTYSEAQTGTTILLTGAMSKMGAYGLVRILMPIFPEPMGLLLTPLLWLAVVTVVFSACAAFAQRDLKRILAYSSINHLGYCVLGVLAAARLTDNQPYWIAEKAAALNGVFLQMFNHGLTASALFCFVSFLEGRSSGLRGIDDFGGLRKVAPVFCGLMGISVFASMGLPGLNGFVGEFLILKGAFSLAGWATALATIGLLVTAVFLLTLLQRVFNGPLNERWSKFKDLSVSERIIVLPATILMFAIGICPQIIIETINPTVLRIVSQLN